jgi:hypothetical protein
MGSSSQTYSHSLDFGLIGFLAEASVAPSLQIVPAINVKFKWRVKVPGALS